MKQEPTFDIVSTKDGVVVFQMTAMTTGIMAAFLAMAIPMVQTDWISRRIVSNRTLQAKRNAQYQYQWKQALEKTLHYLTHVYLHLEQHPSPPPPTETFGLTVSSSSLSPSIPVYWYATDHEVETLVQQLLDPTISTASPRLLWIGLTVDQDDPRGEYYLYLLQHFKTPDHPTATAILKVPWVMFGLKLYERMEQQVTTTTLCFVADASSNLGTPWITDLVESSQCGVVVIKEPLWMATFAFLAQQRIVSTEKLQRILFGLCRFEAWRVRNQLGETKTVMFTLPGQGVVSVLLPLVQAAFPEDRHVFCYDGCVASVERATSLIHHHHHGSSTQTIYQQSSFQLQSRRQRQQQLETVLQWNYHPMANIATSIHPTKLSSAIPNWMDASRKLPVQVAGIVHAWMDSVDTFLQLKTMTTTSSSGTKKSPQLLPTYLPYVCKLSFLLLSSSISNSDGHSNDSGVKDAALLSLSSLLQYITGYHFPARPLPSHVWEAAVAYWENSRGPNTTSSTTVSPLLRASIEDCVFRHKSILLGDKTLPDTVLPALHWTLKQASKKSSCACCAPNEEDDDDQEEEDDGDMNTPITTRNTPIQEWSVGNELGSEGSLPRRRRANFVDGKTAFAFDPTAFSNKS